ncbi:thioredoxin domain-containing protein [Streptomyces sp. YIM S03343]
MSSNQRTSLAELRDGEKRVEAVKRRALVFGAVSTAIALAAGVGIGYAVHGDGGSDETVAAAAAADAPLVVPAHSTGSNGTVVVYGRADAPTTVQVFEDMRCPYCGLFEKNLGKSLTTMADSGKVKIEFHLAAFLDKRLGGNGSMTALAALGAALNEGGAAKFKAYHDVLYAAQPKEETDDTFASTATLLDLAAKVPGLRSPSFNQAVKEVTYLPWAKKVNEAFYKTTDVTGTPTLKINGKKVEVLTASGDTVSEQQFTKNVEAAIAAK